MGDLKSTSTKMKHLVPKNMVFKIGQNPATLCHFTSGASKKTEGKMYIKIGNQVTVGLKL